MAYTVNTSPIGGSAAFANVQNAWAGIINAYDNPNSKANLQRDAIQQSLIDKANLEEQDLYNKINILPGTHHATLDSNIKDFYMNKIDETYDYEMARKMGQMSSRDANMMLAKLNNDMDMYTKLAPQIFAQATIMKEAIKNGSISRANADPMQMMFIGIAENAGNITIKEDEGGIYLEGSGEINGNAWEGKINLKDIQQYLATEGAQIARTIPTSAEMGLSTIFNDLKTKGKFNEFMTTSKVSNNDGTYQQVTEFTAQGAIDARNHLMENTQLFENLMRSDLAPATWADVANHDLSAEELNGTIGDTMMVDGKEVPNPLAGKEKWGVWDPNDPEKVAYMREKLIDRMLAENLPTKLIGELKTDQAWLNMQKATLDQKTNRLGNLSAGAKKALYRQEKIVAAWNAGDLESLTNLVPGIEVIKQKDGRYIISKTEIVEDELGNKEKKVKTLYNGNVNFKDRTGYDDLYDIFGVSDYGAELGLDADKLTGYSANVYGKTFQGIGETLDNYMRKNPKAKIEDILNVKAQDSKGKDIPGQDIESLLKPAGITIVDGEFSIDTDKNPELAKFDGLVIDNKNIFEIIDWINNNELILEKQELNRIAKIRGNVKKNKPTK